MTGRHGRRPARPARRAVRRPARRNPLASLRPARAGSGRLLPAAADRAGAAIFRDEALRARSRRTEVPDVAARLGAPWISWLYRAAMVAVAAGLVLSVTARTARESDGSAVVSPAAGRFTAVLPVGVVPDLTRTTLAVRFGGSPPVTVTVTRARLASPALIRQAGLTQPAQPSVLLTGRLAPGPARRVAGAVTGGQGGRAVTPVALVTHSEPIAAVLVSQFAAMLSGGGS